MDKYRLNHYQSQVGTIYWSVFKGKPHMRYRSGDDSVDLGMAFRTKNKLVGFLPFYDKTDLNMNGEVSFSESIHGMLNPFSGDVTMYPDPK